MVIITAIERHIFWDVRKNLSEIDLMKKKYYKRNLIKVGLLPNFRDDTKNEERISPVSNKGWNFDAVAFT